MFTLALWLEVGRWRRAGRTARLWWRDDDAVGGSAALDRLLRASDAWGVPLTLAAVPGGDMAGLGERLSRAAVVTVVQHGVDHQNRRSGQVAGEFPHDWPQERVETALRHGRRLIGDLPRVQAVFVPPWNDIHPRLAESLRACGYAGWSASGTVASSEGVPRVDVHLDLLRWRGAARFRGRGRFLRALTAELRRRRKAGLWEAPIGLLTHHLAHDAPSWAFLDAFLRWTTERREMAWVALPALIGEAAGRSQPSAASSG